MILHTVQTGCNYNYSIDTLPTLTSSECLQLVGKDLLTLLSNPNAIPCNAYNLFVAELRANGPARVLLTVVVVLKSFQRNVIVASQEVSVGIVRWDLNNMSLPAVFSLASKANGLANIEIGAPAIDLVILANDLVSGDAVTCSDRITDISRLDYIPLVARWFIKKGELSTRQGETGELASSGKNRKKFGSRKTHIC